MKKISYLFFGLAILLSDVMCAVVAFNYGKMLWGTKNAGYSAPASTAFLWAIPFLIGIIVCIIIALVAKKKR
ncbi:hypothetical protein [Oscillibacter sp. ER4]|mgnify:FL=1|jgi:hypothetical protein|uniref:hypothetical protein n=1 Tax=Oscillibacter sp. ER4 TaxID=1519439 RepID=UPI00051C83F0|nr:MULTISPECIES: hypothetical protein [Eubacteriales]